ncbi:MAG: hypothetical protein ACLGIF_09835 [Actinomycetes bacterium]
MAPANIEKARTFIRVLPVVHSVEATQKLAASLRRLGADRETVAKLTGQDGVRPASR